MINFKEILDDYLRFSSTTISETNKLSILKAMKDCYNRGLEDFASEMDIISNQINDYHLDILKELKIT